MNQWARSCQSARRLLGIYQARAASLVVEPRPRGLGIRSGSGLMVQRGRSQALHGRSPLAAAVSERCTELVWRQTCTACAVVGTAWAQAASRGPGGRRTAALQALEPQAAFPLPAQLLLFSGAGRAKPECRLSTRPAVPPIAFERLECPRSRPFANRRQPHTNFSRELQLDQRLERPRGPLIRRCRLARRIRVLPRQGQPCLS